MDRYILEYIKAKHELKQSTFISKKYWRKRIVFLHNILKENNTYRVIINKL